MQPFFLHPRDVDIAADHLFWFAPPDDALMASLDRLGQVTPALAVMTEGRPILAAGSRRAAALREIRGRTLAAVAVDLKDLAPDRSDGPGGPDGQGLAPGLSLGLLYLASNLGRTVTDSMLVAAGRYFLGHGSFAAFTALAGPYLFAPNDRRVRLLAQWLSLPSALDGFLASGHLPLAGAEALAGCDAGTLAALTPLWEGLRWSRANLENALTWLAEAARVSGEHPTATLARAGVLDLADRGLSPNDLAAGVLAGLRRLRYPATTDLEARFAALARDLAKGSAVRLRPRQGFESDCVTVEVTVRRPADLAKAAASLAAMAGAPALPRLLGLAREDASS